MAQIIKGTEKPTLKPKKSVIIKGSVYQEMQEIVVLNAQTEQEHKKIIAKGKEQAHLAKEQALVEGANQAFSEAAEQTLIIFAERTQYCLELKEPLKRLCDEISQKILGGKLTLSDSEQEKILQAAIQKIRSRHKLKIQAASLGELDKLKALPDFEIEIATDLPAGFLRVVTEAGSALWEEKIAIPKILSAL
ncbi:MAG: hypothetical protein WCK42_03765 [Myxococcaceae bacterium]